MKRNTVEDQLQEYWTICCEQSEVYGTGALFRQKVASAIAAARKKHNRETNKLYNPFRNVSLDLCYADSQIPLAERRNLSNEQPDAVFYTLYGDE